jgi:hypothetical protein
LEVRGLPVLCVVISVRIFRRPVVPETTPQPPALDRPAGPERGIGHARNALVGKVTATAVRGGKTRNAAVGSSMSVLAHLNPAPTAFINPTSDVAVVIATDRVKKGQFLP